MLEFGFYNMDCMEGMKEMPDGYIDLAIVDPPYGIGADNFKNASGYVRKDGFKQVESAAVRAKNRLNAGGRKLKNRTLNNSNCSWDVAPGKEYFDELFRVSKHQIIWGGNYFDLPPTRGIIVWDKQQPWENFSQVEMAWSNFDSPASLFRMRNSRNTGEQKVHPCEKPIELYIWLLNRYAKDGWKLLDTHVGSGNSLIAMHKCGFKDVYGFEINETYFNIANDRVQKEKQQVTIFDLQEQLV